MPLANGRTGGGGLPGSSPPPAVEPERNHDAEADGAHDPACAPARRLVAELDVVVARRDLDSADHVIDAVDRRPRPVYGGLPAGEPGVGQDQEGRGPGMDVDHDPLAAVI